LTLEKQIVFTLTRWDVSCGPPFVDLPVRDIVPSIVVNDALIPAPESPIYTADPIPSRFNSTANEVNMACVRASAGAEASLQCRKLCDQDFSKYCRPFLASMVNNTGTFLDSNNESETTFVDYVESCVDYANSRWCW
jgi:hypothetical protein